MIPNFGLPASAAVPTFWILRGDPRRPAFLSAMPKPRSRRTFSVPPATHLIHFKVTLQDTRPPIWRRIVVPDNYTLGQLHRVLQIVMGWTDSHLHSFHIGDQIFGMKLDNSEDDDPKEADENSALLHTFSLRRGAKIVYEYDFGDSWIHVLAVEKLVPATESHPRAVCLAGRRACPPEDCGGIWGYQRVLQVLKRVRNDDDAEFREWVGDYDPARFDLDEISRRLA